MAAVSPPRLFVPGASLSPGDEVVLPEAEARHVRSRRLEGGSEVVLLDGAGRRILARLLPGLGSAAVERELEARGEPDRATTVLLAAAEPDRVEWAVEKGTECGAAAFVIFPGARSQGPAVRRLEGRIDRLSRIAAEAAKQCDRTLVPAVVWVPSLREALAAAPRPLVVALPGAPPRPLLPPSRALALAVGPEGGWDLSEEVEMAASGGVAIGLGPRVLRLETAVVAALCALALVDPPGPDPASLFSATMTFGGPA